MIKPKYKIIFTDSDGYKDTCGKCVLPQCVHGSPIQYKCVNLEKSLSKYRNIYFKKVN